MKKYKIIYADPPWSYNDKMGNDVAFQAMTYPTMNLEEIKKLKINSISDNDCVLFMWAVSPLLKEAFEVIEHWGFRYKTVAFVWNKQTVNGIDISNMGRWTMGNVEVCLLGTKGKPQRIRKYIKQLITATRREHSRKPDEARERIVQLMGNLSRIELFARDDGSKNLFGENPLDGWDVWGNEVENDITL